MSRSRRQLAAVSSPEVDRCVRWGRPKLRARAKAKVKVKVKVVIVTASMGGGHNGAAEELARRVRERGAEAVSIEFLDAQPMRIGWGVRRLFLWVLNRAPWIYETAYQSCLVAPTLFGPLVRLDCALSARRLRKQVLSEKPDVIVSTYPLSSLVLGRERQAGRIGIPVVTFLTDFSVHPLWVHPGVDLHLAVSAAAAERAVELSGGRALAVGALVNPRFRSEGDDLSCIRSDLGLSREDRVALVVAGSWGVGQLEQTLSDIESSGRIRTITICGEDESLRRRLSLDSSRIVLGWTDDMSGMMSASDVLVENAGGLTSLEAMTCGLPVITYRPIAGHGRDNAAAMAAAGVSRFAETLDEFTAALEELTLPGPTREALQRRAAAAVNGDPSEHIMAMVAPIRTDNVFDLLPHRTHRVRPRRVQSQQL